MTKQELLHCIIEELSQEIANAEQNFKMTMQAAADAPGAMQSHSDTTKSQMSRLAEGIQRSINEKNQSLRTLRGMADENSFSGSYEEVKIGSIVEVLSEHDERVSYFILPVGGGIKITDNKRVILTATPQAPLIAALLGKKRNQTIILQMRPKQKKFTIVNIW